MKPFEQLPPENLSIIKTKIKQRLVGFDPLTIIMIISLAINVIKTIYECRKKNAVFKYALRRNSLFSRVFIKEKLYDKLIENGLSDEEAERACEQLKDFYAQEDVDGLLKPLYE